MTLLQPETIQKKVLRAQIAKLEEQVSDLTYKADNCERGFNDDWLYLVLDDCIQYAMCEFCNSGWLRVFQWLEARGYAQHVEAYEIGTAKWNKYSITDTGREFGKAFLREYLQTE